MADQRVSPERVLITRAAPDALEFGRLCANAGFAPVYAPVLTFEIHKQRLELSKVGALAFTSANGVRAYCANADKRDLPVFAVGEATAAAARSGGFLNVYEAGGDVASLSKMIASSPPAAGAVLHVGGVHQAGDLSAMLKMQHINATFVPVYEMRAAQSLPRSCWTPAPHWISLFSARTASIFADLVAESEKTSLLRTIRVACLSEQAAQPVRAFGWKQIVIARNKSAAGVIEAMKTPLETQASDA